MSFPEGYGKTIFNDYWVDTRVGASSYEQPRAFSSTTSTAVSNVANSNLNQDPVSNEQKGVILASKNIIKKDKFLVQENHPTLASAFVDFVANENNDNKIIYDFKKYFVNCILQNPNSFCSQELANIVWAFEKLECKDLRFIDVLKTTIALRLHTPNSFTPEELNLISFAFLSFSQNASWPIDMQFVNALKRALVSYSESVLGHENSETSANTSSVEALSPSNSSRRESNSSAWSLVEEFSDWSLASDAEQM